MNTIHTKTGYKKTKLGWIPEEWKISKLTDLVKPSRPIRYGIVQTGKYIEDGIPCIRVVDLTKGELDRKLMIRTSPKINVAYKKTVVQENDIIFALRGAIGKVTKIDKKIAGINITRGTALISPCIEIEPNYLLWQIRSENVIRNIMIRVSGSALKEIPIGELKKVLVPVSSSRKEQKKIAKILSTWDKAIQKLEQLIQKKQQLKKGLMQVLLTGEMRFKEFVQKAGFKETKLGQMPQDWEIEEIGRLTKICTGNKDTQDRIENGKYPFFVRSNTIERINSFSFDGEAILTSGDGVGVGKIFHYLNERFDYHQRVYNIHEFNQNLNGKYFFFYFSNHFYRRVKRMSAKNSVDSVRMDMISKMNIPLPVKEEQKKIAQVLNTCDQEINQLEKELAAFKQQKKGLMQVLLTGEKRVKIET